MPEIIPFSFNETAIRVVISSSGHWFVAKDVASILGYTNPQKAVRDHCKQMKPIGVNESFTLDPQTKIIPEPDVYRLVMRSKLPQAQKFESWVLEEVLPTIRKHGVYSNLDFDNASRSELIHSLVKGKRENQALWAQLEASSSHVLAFHLIAGSSGTTCITDTAKQLQLRRKTLFTWLEDNKWIFKRKGRGSWIAYQSKINQGLLVHKLGPVWGNFPEGIGQVRVTKKGLAKLAEIMSTTLAA